MHTERLFFCSSLHSLTSVIKGGEDLDLFNSICLKAFMQHKALGHDVPAVHIGALRAANSVVAVVGQNEEVQGANTDVGDVDGSQRGQALVLRELTTRVQLVHLGTGSKRGGSLKDTCS